MLLLAGSPGTGKSYLKKLICKAIPDFFTETSIDAFKEWLYDEKGFDNRAEKVLLDKHAYELFYQSVENLMKKNQSIISDYPFSYRQHDTLQKLAIKHRFYIITVTLVCDSDVLYKRQRKRDLDPGRHLGFVMNHYHHGDRLTDRSQMDIQKSQTEFETFNNIRGYSDFQLGKTIFLDVTDFDKADYRGTIEKVKKWIK